MERRNPFLLLSPPALPESSDRPIEVCLYRGNAIESRHRVHARVCDADGKSLRHWGEQELLVFPRSSIKLAQACSWVALGAAEKFGIGEEELALACASHHGQPAHTERVSAWLERLGCTESSLECGCHAPYHAATAGELLRRGQEPSQLHNNCSGKHAGLLTLCRFRSFDPEGYSSYDHPAQLALRERLGEFFSVDAGSFGWGIDGCGIPSYALPLRALALGMARFADPSALDPAGSEAVRRLNRAITRHPLLIGGDDSFCSRLIAESQGRVMAKVGAEGVYGAWIPKEGLGIALKAECGAGRAAEQALVAVLRELGFSVQFHSPLLRRWTGEIVGQFVCA